MALSDTEKAALKRFRKLVKANLRDKVVKFSLFGSKARGDDRPDSDLDVLVLTSSGDWRLRDKVYDVASDLLLDTQVMISPKVMSRSHYNRMKAEGFSFFVNVSRDAVPI